MNRGERFRRPGQLGASPKLDLSSLHSQHLENITTLQITRILEEGSFLPRKTYFLAWARVFWLSDNSTILLPSPEQQIPTRHSDEPSSPHNELTPRPKTPQVSTQNHTTDKSHLSAHPKGECKCSPLSRSSQNRNDSFKKIVRFG